MPLFSFTDALDVLETYVTNALASSTDFQLDSSETAPFIAVVRVANRASEMERSGRAYFLLSGTNERAPDWGFQAQKVNVVIACRASENAGGLPSPTRAYPIQEVMARRVELLFETNYSDFRDLGLLNARCRRTREGAQSSADGESETPVHFVDLEISAYYLAQ